MPCPKQLTQRQKETEKHIGNEGTTPQGHIVKDSIDVNVWLVSWLNIGLCVLINAYKFLHFILQYYYDHVIFWKFWFLLNKHMQYSYIMIIII